MTKLGIFTICVSGGNDSGAIARLSSMEFGRAIETVMAMLSVPIVANPVRKRLTMVSRPC